MWLRIWLWWAIFSFLLLQERRFCIFTDITGQNARWPERSQEWRKTPQSPSEPISVQSYQRQKGQSGIKLTQSQREAVEKSLGHSVSIITGGPGTGKTTIINTLIKIMEQSGLDVAVAAPNRKGGQRG